MPISIGGKEIFAVQTEKDQSCQNGFARTARNIAFVREAKSNVRGPLDNAPDSVIIVTILIRFVENDPLLESIRLYVPPSSSGLGHWILSPVTGVRFP